MTTEALLTSRVVDDCTLNKSASYIPLAATLTHHSTCPITLRSDTCPIFPLSAICDTNSRPAVVAVVVRSKEINRRKVGLQERARMIDITESEESQSSGNLWQTLLEKIDFQDNGSLTRLPITNHPNLFQTLDMVIFIEFIRNLFNESTGRPVTRTSQLLAINNGRSIAQL